MGELDEVYFFSSLARRYPHPRFQEGIAALPDSWKSFCKQIPLHENSPPESFLIGYERVHSIIHPSWESEIFLQLPEDLVSRLSSLPGKLSRFFMDYAVQGSPFSEVPKSSDCFESPFFSLLQMTKDDLKEVIELLSIFFIVESYLKIVDRKRLSKIARLLNEKQKKWLSFLLLSPKHFSFEQIDLDAILKKEISQGKEALFESGESLFAQALYGENESLLKLICYTLEISLGKNVLAKISKLSRKEEKAQNALRFILEFMKHRKGTHS